MSELTIVSHEMFGELPLKIVSGIEWFGATEAASALKFSNPHKGIDNHVEEDDCTVHTVIDKLGRKQKKKFINESGLYSLIFGASKQSNNQEIKERAKQFKRWVTHDVLPSIRKQGMYMSNTLVHEIQNNPEIIHFLAEQVAKINTSNNSYHEQTSKKLESIDRKIEGEYVTPQDIDAIKYAVKVKAEKIIETSGVQLTIDTVFASDIYEQAKISKRQKAQYKHDLGKIKSRILVLVKKKLGMKGNSPNNHIKRKDVDLAIQYIKDMKRHEIAV